MKVKLTEVLDDEYAYPCGWSETDSEHAPEVEVPDAIMIEYRACQSRIKELEKYFDEAVKPQLEAAEKIKQEERQEAYQIEVENRHPAFMEAQRPYNDAINRHIAGKFVALRQWFPRMFDDVAKRKADGTDD